MKKNGVVKDFPSGYSFTTAIFGLWVPLLRGEPVICSALCMVAIVLTAWGVYAGGDAKGIALVTSTLMIVCNAIWAAYANEYSINKKRLDGWLIEQINTDTAGTQHQDGQHPATFRPEYRKCPFCAEDIKFEAIKCKHCGSSIEPINTNPSDQIVATSQTAQDSPRTECNFGDISQVKIPRPQYEAVYIGSIKSRLEKLATIENNQEKKNTCHEIHALLEWFAEDYPQKHESTRDEYRKKLTDHYQ